jgi:hypothetical protein
MCLDYSQEILDCLIETFKGGTFSLSHGTKTAGWEATTRKFSSVDAGIFFLGLIDCQTHWLDCSMAHNTFQSITWLLNTVCDDKVLTEKESSRSNVC